MRKLNSLFKRITLDKVASIIIIVLFVIIIKFFHPIKYDFSPLDLIVCIGVLGAFKLIIKIYIEHIFKSKKMNVALGDLIINIKRKIFIIIYGKHVVCGKKITEHIYIYKEPKTKNKNNIYIKYITYKKCLITYIIYARFTSLHKKPTFGLKKHVISSMVCGKVKKTFKKCISKRSLKFLGRKIFSKKPTKMSDLSIIKNLN